MTDVCDHPQRAAMAAVQSEQSIVNTDEAMVLKDAIFAAVDAYQAYLDRNGLLFDADGNALADGLVIESDLLGTVDIRLKNGPIHRRYGGGQQPDGDLGRLTFEDN